MRFLTTWLPVLVVLLVPTACGLHTEDAPLEPDGSVTLAVAETRINELARDVVHYAVGRDAVLDGSDQRNPISFACSRYSKAPPGSPHVSQYTYDVALPDPGRASDALARFDAYLHERGWTLEPHSTPSDRVFRHENYEIAMTLAGREGLFVTMGTGCLVLR